MTDRETRLRTRVDMLTDQRDEFERQRDRLAARVLRLERRLGHASKRCRYCGYVTEARDGVCDAHADLVKLEAY